MLTPPHPFPTHTILTRNLVGAGLASLPSLPRCVLLRYRSAQLNWHFRPHNPAIITTTIRPEEGLLLVTARQLSRRLELRVEAPRDSFARVGGPTRGGFVPHSVESYSATATAGGRGFFG